MGAIVYQITGDQNPYTVQLLPGFPLIYINIPGTYQINDIPDGDYILRITDRNGCVNNHEVFIGIPVTTTTTEAITVTTTPDMQSVPCNMLMFITNGQTYDKVYSITLSADLGFIALRFSVPSKPVRFVLEYEGVEVIDTGYHGSDYYQAALDAALILLGEPAAVIDPNTEYAIAYIKTTDTDFAILHVYCPLNNTSGTFSVSCVDSTYTESYVGEFEEHLCQLSDTTTTTTTEEPVTTTTTIDLVTTTTTEDIVVTTTTGEPVTTTTTEEEITTTTTACTRPEGLTDIVLENELSYTGGSVSFTGSYQEAADALCLASICTPPDLAGIAGITGQTLVMDVSNVVYSGTVGIGCNKVPDGYYLYDRVGSFAYIVHIVSGIVISKDSFTCVNCPTTTTTTV